MSKLRQRDREKFMRDATFYYAERVGHWKRKVAGRGRARRPMTAGEFRRRMLSERNKGVG